MFLVPVDEVEVKDTWHVDGMAATGSRDIVARVGSGAVPPRVERPARSVSDATTTYLRRIPVRPFLALTAGIPAIGCARRAVQLFRDSHDRASAVRDDQATSRDDDRRRSDSAT